MFWQALPCPCGPLGCPANELATGKERASAEPVTSTAIFRIIRVFIFSILPCPGRCIYLRNPWRDESSALYGLDVRFARLVALGVWSLSGGEATPAARRLRGRRRGR